MKKILLVGGEGYIGKVIAEKLIKKNYYVYSFDNLLYEQKFSPSKKNFKFIYGNINNPDDLKKIFKEDFYAMVLLAGLVGDPITKKYPKLAEKANYYGLRNIINFFYKSKIKRLLFISTCSNYGVIDDKIFAKETHKLSPKSLYAKHKVKMEEYLLSKKNNKKKCFSILRFATAYGVSKRMRFDLTVNEFVKDMFFGKRVIVYESNTWRPYCHVDDFAKVVELVISSSESKIRNEIFNVGSMENNFSKKIIINKLKRFFPKSKVLFTNIKKDPRNYKVNFEKIKKTFKFQPVSFSNGLAGLIKFLKENKKMLKNNSNLGNYVINEKTIR